MDNENINSKKDFSHKFIVFHSDYNNDKSFISSNQNDKRAFCFECKKSFYYYITLKTHIKNVHRVQTKVCTFCNGEFKYLNKHLKSCRFKRNKINKSFSNDIIINIQALNISKINLTKEIFYYPNFIIDSGSSMNVYYGKNKKNNEDLAIKINISTDIKFSKLLFENYVTEQMQNTPGFPRNYGSFGFGDKTIIIETLLGPSIKKLYEYCDNEFTQRTICLVFIQTLKRLKSLHQMGFLHNDLNMHNLSWARFYSGKSIDKEIINLIDFGLSSRYVYPIFNKNKKNNNIIGYESYPKEKLNIIHGSIAYLDKSVLEGFRPCRKTDIISLIYLVIEMFKGDLPWKKSYQENLSEELAYIKKIHKNIKIIDLFEKIPCEFYTIYTEVQKLNFSDEPDYDRYENIVLNLLLKSGGKINEKFCWEPKIEETIEKIKNKKASEGDIKNFYLLFKGFPI